jgi:hypothetical protein
MIYFEQIRIYRKLRKLHTNANSILSIAAQLLIMVMTAVKFCSAESWPCFQHIDLTAHM